MVLKLHGTLESPFVRLVAAVLLEKQVPFELVFVDFHNREHKSPEYLSKQPFGQIPYIGNLLLYCVIWIVNGTPARVNLKDFEWLYQTSVNGLALSLTTNALVTGLIVSRIFQVFREAKAASDDKILGTAGGNKLRRIILVLIESAMALFSIQLTRLLVNVLTKDAGGGAFPVVSAIHEMLNGITPTIILVRTAMGLSFHDEKSMEEVAIESLRFASDHPNSSLETGNIGLVSREDGIDLQQSTNDIDVVER